ncbi:protein-tyrosine phosphatase-like protein [Pseudomassariella vexata]|uniref:Protein-tyrosine phosphatase-like protein n=1 Tax=Pseudomassariella vexata TaxID=1141098 RepID=A0A1Y2E6M8_9PEZI|nr:protein-tyrosine phosphatase-like protein [Pseudomassariella vexata]ORY67220.1 protein-tyrosine phosphatase-like protein [Pseudomassariella vexata]
MDHISSRFRRTSRKGALSPAPTPVSARTSADSRLAPRPSTDSPPVLSITPTTTPPRSSHSSQSNHSIFPPKSPLNPSKFRGFHFRSSHKRARSPAPASLPQPSSPAVVKNDGTDTGGRVGLEKAREPFKIPAFLAMSEQDILAKYTDIVWLERERMLESMTNPSPTFKYARPDPAFRTLDRYANIQPWDNNRVKLRVPEGAVDYINASPIVLNSPLDAEARPPHIYIAMQGPRVHTAEHVWRMVSEQLESPAVVVMLTETHENNLEKCYPYFPHAVDETMEIGEDDEFEDGFRGQVKCVNVEDKADGAIEMRKLNLHIDGRDDDMEVWHLLYKRWPDFGVPALQDIESFFELMRLSRAKNASERNPRIVHCSAGVGRSGTFIALEHLMREVESGDLERYDETHEVDAADLVFDTVNALREQRKMMVQSEPQFLFIYQVLRKQWMEKYGVEDSVDEPAAKRLEVGHDPFVEE